MFLTAMLLSGGALVAGVKLYLDNKRKKETPWIVDAKKNGVRKKKKTLVMHLSSSSDPMQTPPQTAKEDLLGFFRTRRQQMVEMAGSEVSEAEKAVNRQFAIASGNLALAGISLFYPPLLWVMVAISIYSTIPFYTMAYKAVIRNRRMSSYVLDALLFTGELVGGFFYTQVITVWFSLLGLKLLALSEHTCKQSLSNLFDAPPRSVWVVTDDGSGSTVEVEMPFETLQRGDIVMVSAGQTICVDGVIASGFASIDQHKLTGESQPVEKGVGAEVLASTIVLAGRIGVCIDKTGEETVAMQIGKILDQTVDLKGSLQSQGEAMADKLALPVLGLGILFYPLFGLSSAIAVFTNEFGYKMRLFAPASTLIFLNIASHRGILIKDGRSLELLQQVDTVVFDKTGTLTLEQPTVGQIHTYHGYDQNEILRYAAAAEDGQTHPIAKAILAAAKEQALVWPKIVDAKYEMGFGIQVNLSDRVIRVGSDKFMAMNDIHIPNEVKQVQSRSHEDGHSLVLVAFDDHVAGVIELHATIRPEAKDMIHTLRQRGISMYIISGDHEAPTKKLAETLGIEHYFANTLPENKANLVATLQDEGRCVCFLGDGINDSIALKQANVSVSLRGATMIATDTAQVILMDGTLNRLGEMFDIAEQLSKNMRVNYYLSTMPCIVCLSGIVLFHWGVITGMTITLSALFAGIVNSTRPLLTQKRIENTQKMIE
ncbi:MAG: heavy metal translocating P-type ATPase [Chloroflexota bacterium]